MPAPPPPEPPAGPGRRWPGAAVAGWSLLLALLLLGPALGPGLVLSYDMVWVPDLALRADVLGVGTGLPRAVPSDAVVAVVDEVLPGPVLQKVVLLGALVGGGLGAARLAAAHGLGTASRLAAVTLWQWNPLVVERLVLGHWPVLVGYAALPWLLVAAGDWRRSGRLPARLAWLLPLGSLSVSAGLVSCLAVVAAAATRDRGRWLRLGALCLASQAPWLVSGLLHAGRATTDPVGSRLFALSDEGLLPGPLAALGLGGAWNVEVVPDSRLGPVAVLALVVLLALVALGLPDLRRAAGTRGLVVLGGLWCVGWGVAVLTWLAPEAVGSAAAVVPGLGVVRDGSRLLVLCVPLLVLAVAHGTQRVVVAVAGRTRSAGAAPALVAAAVLVLWPVTTLPDAAWGASGRLGTAEYPDAYAQARAVLSSTPQAGDLLVLPLSSYRQPEWNGGRKVLDPLGRYLPPVPVASDALVVRGEDGEVEVAGEDPRVAAAARALATPTPALRARELAGLGIGLVAVDSAAGEAPDVAGRVLLDRDGLLLLALDGVRPRSTPRAWWVAAATAWAAYVGLAAAGVAVGLRGALRTRRRGVVR